MIKRSFLKWAGGKANALSSLWQHMPREGDRFIEPFMGSGTVSLNTSFTDYELYDGNSDLVTLFQWAVKRPGQLIKAANSLFVDANNTKSSYLSLRQAYNKATDQKERALILLYLNRHCYNGLVRYSERSGFNVPFGDYSSPKVPEEQILVFSEKFRRAKIAHRWVEDLRLCGLSGNTVVYCDPPYLPLSRTASFSQYTAAGFSLRMQSYLNMRAKGWRDKGAQVFVSNHDAPILDSVYRHYHHKFTFSVSRTISQKSTERKPAKEVLLEY